MNKYCILSIAIALSAVFQLHAQEKGTIGFTFSAMNKNSLLQSAAENHNYITHRGRGFMSFSADYWYPINKWLDFETGINYSLQSFGETIDDPNIVYVTAPSPRYYDINMLNIPIGFRVNFLKYGFVNSGVLLDLTHEPGIGSYFGVGAKLESEVGFGIFINPYVKMHSVLPVNFNENVNRILESGIRVGVAYSFDNAYRRRR